MKRPSLRKTSCAALCALTLTATPAFAEYPATGLARIHEPQRLGGVPLPADLSLEEQLNVMISSGVLDEEMRLRSAHKKHGGYEFCVAVTDLDYNGRLELLISRHTLSYEPFAEAGEGISAKERKALTALCTESLVTVQSVAYEVSADGKRLEEIPIRGESGIAPDFAGLYIKPRMDEGGYTYHVYTQRLTSLKKVADAPARYPIALEKQTLRLAEGAMHLAWTAHSEGTAAIDGDSYEPDFTSMEIHATGEIIDPSRVPKELRLGDEGNLLFVASDEDIASDPLNQLFDLWNCWTEAQDVIDYDFPAHTKEFHSAPQLSGARG